MNSGIASQVIARDGGGQAKRRRTRLALAFSSGLLFAAAFPPVPTGVAAFAALLPFLFLMDDMSTWRDAFRWSYLTFLVGNAGTLWWISGWWGEDPWLKAAGVAVNFIYPLFFTVPALLYHVVRRRLGTLAAAGAFPALWTAWEWLAHFPELSFPWLLLANTQTYDLANIQFIAWTGAFGLSFWVALINALLFVMTRQLLSGTWTLRSKRMMATAAMLLLAVLLPKLHSSFVLGEEAESHGEVTIGIIQPDIDPYDKWGSGETPLGKLRALMEIYDSLAAYRPDLVLLPETAIPFRVLQHTYAAEWRWLRRHVDSVGVPLLAGFPHTVWYENPDTAPASARRIEGSDLRYHDFNAAMLLEPGEDIPQIYHKSRLTPLSERIPYLDALPFMQDALTWGVGISNWGVGSDTAAFRLRSAKVSTAIWAMICYETLYPSFVAGFADRGAEVFATMCS
ncbi:MAG: apolipoprotein N-acyltransferase, partial [Bacteroidota bacterium]|nr:apolipoprotein N-acyltransferase [Bacteroidota bacterium]